MSLVDLADAVRKFVVIGVGNGKKFDAVFHQLRDRVLDVVAKQCEMLAPAER